MTMLPLMRTAHFLFSFAFFTTDPSPNCFHAHCLNEPIREIATSITLPLDDVETILEQGQQHLKQKDWKAAVVEFSKAIAKNPDKIAAYVGLGSALEGLEQWDQAIKQYGLAVAKDSNSVAAYLGRARAWSQKKEPAKALADLDTAVSIDADGGDACFTRGAHFQLQKDWVKAEQDYSTVIDKRPTYTPGYRQRAFVRIQKGELAKATSDYDAAIGVDPKDPENFAGRALTYSLQKQFAKALEDYDRALELAPDYSLALNNKAWLLATCSDRKFRDTRLALELAVKAVQQDPSPTILDTLAVCFAALGDFDKAVIQLKRALAIKNLSEAEAQELKEHLALFEKKMPLP